MPFSWSELQEKKFKDKSYYKVGFYITLDGIFETSTLSVGEVVQSYENGIPLSILKNSSIDHRSKFLIEELKRRCEQANLPLEMLKYLTIDDDGEGQFFIYSEVLTLSSFTDLVNRLKRNDDTFQDLMATTANLLPQLTHDGQTENLVFFYDEKNRILQELKKEREKLSTAQKKAENIDGSLNNFKKNLRTYSLFTNARNYAQGTLSDNDFKAALVTYQRQDENDFQNLLHLEKRIQEPFNEITYRTTRIQFLEMQLESLERKINKIPKPSLARKPKELEFAKLSAVEEVDKLLEEMMERNSNCNTKSESDLPSNKRVKQESMPELINDVGGNHPHQQVDMLLQPMKSEVTYNNQTKTSQANNQSTHLLVYPQPFVSQLNPNQNNTQQRASNSSHKGNSNHNHKRRER